MQLDPISENIGTGLENIRVFKNFIEEEDIKRECWVFHFFNQFLFLFLLKFKFFLSVT